MKTITCSLLTILCAFTLRADDGPKPDATHRVSRKDLLTVALSPEKTVSRLEVKEVVLPVGAPTGYHLHPCPTVGVIESGEVAFQIEGQPLHHLRAGDAFCEPANMPIARFDNEGTTPVRMSVVYLLGKDDKEIIHYLRK